MLLEEYIPGHVAASENVIIDPNTIASATASNSGITNITGVYDDSNATTPIFTINPTQPTPEVEPNTEP